MLSSLDDNPHIDLEGKLIIISKYQLSIYIK